MMIIKKNILLVFLGIGVFILTIGINILIYNVKNGLFIDSFESFLLGLLIVIGLISFSIGFIPLCIDTPNENERIFYHIIK